MGGEGQAPESTRSGATMALGAAALFGAGTPIAKLLLADLDPWLLAALLYLGSGIGLAAIRLGRRLWSGARDAAGGEAAPAPADWPWLLGAILFGGVIGPVLLMTGLALTAASAASLLLNLESVLTALIAWFVFRENVDRRIALGMAVIALGAAILCWRGGAGLGGAAGAGTPWGPLAIAGACLAWALDNNLTRRVSLLDPVLIAMLKGLVAGAVNLILALAIVGLPEFGGGAALGGMLAGAALGMLAYGLSLVLFVRALRDIGAARTGAYYAAAPFFGAILAVLALGEPVTWQLILAGGLMLTGLWLHLTERHDHMHEHADVVHAHRHRHDAHHRHDHGPEVPAGEPHSHRHRHTRLRHSHRHFPDAHHAHGHLPRPAAAIDREP